MIPTHIFVTVPEGREVPIPASEGSAPGSTLLRCKPGKVYRVQNTTFTRRRILGGDFNPSTIGGFKVAELESAAAGEDLGALGYELDAEGAVALKAIVSAPASSSDEQVAHAAKTTTRKG